MDDWSQTVDHLLNGYGVSAFPELSNASFVPALDVEDHADKYVVTVEVAGIPKEKISATIDGDRTLVISGSKEEMSEKGAEKHVSERFFGVFHREVRLPENVDVEKITLNYKDGVLRATIPKRGEEKPVRKKLAIE
jgi:HSP20 family protein